MKKVFFPLIFLLNQSVFAQTSSTVLKPVTIVEQRTIGLNGGMRAAMGGKSRVYIEVVLPANTIEWYYAFSTSSTQSGSKNLNLAVQLAALVGSSTNPAGAAISATGLTDDAVSTIKIPAGTNSLDVYLCDRANIDKFIQKVQYSYNMQGSVENTKQGRVRVSNIKTGTWFLGLKNPSTLDPIDVVLEVVALVKETVTIDEWSSQNKGALHNWFLGKFLNKDQTATEISNCALQKVTSDLKPSLFYSMVQSEQANFCQRVLDSCFIETGHANLKIQQRDASKLGQNMQADLVAKQYDSCAAKAIQLINMGYNGYNNAGWCLLFARQYQEALKYFAKGAVLYPNDLFLRGNLAHAYLLTNNFEDAKKIYLDNKKEKLNKDMSWKEMVQKDFNSFEAAGIHSEYFNQIRALLKIK